MSEEPSWECQLDREDLEAYLNGPQPTAVHVPVTSVKDVICSDDDRDPVLIAYIIFVNYNEQ